MTKRITYFTWLLLSFVTQNIFAQKEPEKIIDREHARTIEHIFGGLERNRIPYGLLADIAFPFADLEAYDGTMKDSTQIDVEVFSDLYKALQSSRIDPKTASDFEPLESLATKWAQQRQEHNVDESDVTLVLSGLHYKYASIPESSFWNKTIDIENNMLKDVYLNGVWQNPYVEKETVAIAPPLSVLNTLSFSVLLPETLFYSNNREIKQVYVDFADGKGYKELSFDQKIPLTYAAAGKYVWKFRLEKWGGTFLEFETPIWIDRPVRLFPFPAPGKNNVRISNGNHDAILRIDYAPGHNNKLMKPLIVAEGFDPESVLNPEKVGGSTTLLHFLNSIQEDSELFNLLNSNNQQYDIVYVDWKNGVGDIGENAETLVRVIEWVNNEKQTNGSNEPNIVLGQSMGGLVAAYALSKMEKTGKEHQAALFVAHDTPFQGANTPISSQYLFRHAAATYVSNSFATSVGEQLLPFLQSISSLMGGNFLSGYISPGAALSINDSPAALQMSKYHVDFYNNLNSAIHDTWKQQFDAMGYPQKTRNVAISNGSMCAVPQEVEGGDSMVLINKTDSSNAFWKNVLYRLFAGIWGDTSGNWRLSLVTRIPGRHI